MCCRYVPYVGIVTILMNDYPKFKVRTENWDPVVCLTLSLQRDAQSVCQCVRVCSCSDTFPAAIRTRMRTQTFWLSSVMRSCDGKRQLACE